MLIFLQIGFRQKWSGNLSVNLYIFSCSLRRDTKGIDRHWNAWIFSFELSFSETEPAKSFTKLLLIRISSGIRRGETTTPAFDLACILKIRSQTALSRQSFRRNVENSPTEGRETSANKKNREHPPPVVILYLGHVS